MRFAQTAWVGSAIRLRAIEPKDAQYYAKFNEDSIASRNVFRIVPPMSDSDYENEVCNLSRRVRDEEVFALAIERLSTPGMVGAISVKSADARSGSFEHGLAIEPSYQRSGYGSQASVLLLRYMFGERRYHKSSVSIYGHNEPSLAMHRKLGYSIEGRLREHEFFGGRYCDVVLMGMLASEFFDNYSAIVLSAQNDG
ncbi:GNAT family protein [Dactylosporangium sp. NPDC005555]|uniref:GNAT family N-acetyltransferase n=1 Tax=Dactylosporangium sp. NPDC005555 TaxID=3154889 RepID=UPI0033BDF713